MPKTTDETHDDPFAELSWSDLEQWVGARSVERGRNYQKKRRVLQLARAADGTLSGRVVGSRLYTTHVTCLTSDVLGSLSATCSCPLGGNCKHAVAVVLEYLERLKTGQEIPGELLAISGDGLDLDDTGSDEQDVDDDDGEEVSDTPRRRTGRSRGSGKVDVKAYLQGLAASELVELVAELTETSEEARRLLETRAQLATGQVGEIVSAARKELRRVASEQGWRNSWTGEGHTPNYDTVRKYLSKLLGAGHPDLVLELGRELLELGTDQVGQGDDEGDTGMAISEALVPVWEALGQSSLAPAARILWAYDRYLEDEYDLCNGADDADVWEVDAETWGQVADALVERLAGGGAAGVRAGHNSSLRYHRSCVARWAIDALQKAGRPDEAVSLAVEEARVTSDYDRAVGLLIEAGKSEEARALAMEGIRETQATLPGISARLRSRLLELALAGGDHALAAAFTAEEFALSPCREGYLSLRETARRAGVWDQVRKCVISSLHDCSPAVRHAGWPLPPTGTATEPDDRQLRPYLGLLTEIALDEGDHAEVLRWYRQCAAKGFTWGGGGLDTKVAQGVASTHPDESIAIWKRLAEEAIARANRSAYQESLRYLRPMQRLLAKLGREREWDEYLSGLRAEHRRKRALLETLVGLSDKPIVRR